MGPNQRFRLMGGLPFSASMLESPGRPIWERFGTSLGVLWGPSWAPLGRTWAPLGPSWGSLGAILGPFGGQLGSFRAFADQVEGHLRRCVEHLAYDADAWALR